MNKKILSIIFSLFLVGVFSISCSNSDKTGSGNNTDNTGSGNNTDNTGNGETTKGIEQFNGSTYVSTETLDVSKAGSTIKVYLWVSVKDNKVGITNEANNKTLSGSYFPIYMDVTGSSTDYSFSHHSSAQGTLKFSSDGSSVTVNFTKNAAMPSIEGQNIVCNKK